MNARALAVTAAISARRALADRGGLVVATAFYLVVVSVLASLWRWAAEASDGGVAGYTAVALTWYIATSEAATMSISMRLIEEIGDDVASGSVAAEMLRPASVLWVRVASVLGRSLPRLVACGAGGAALSLAGSARRPTRRWPCSPCRRSCWRSPATWTAAYPVDVFSGAAKVLLYTVVPAAFVGAVPARLLDSFDPLTAAAAVGVALLFAVAGWATFTLGLRRYTSGAAWSRA